MPILPLAPRDLRRRSAIAALALASLTGAALASSADGVPGLDDPRLLLPAVHRTAPSSRFGLRPAAVPEVRLDALRLDAILAEDASAAAALAPKALRVGVWRAVSVGENDGEWFEVPGGRLWIADLTSPGAKGLRLHLRGTGLPAGSELALYAAPEPLDAVLYRGGRRGAERGRGLRVATWTPTVFGERTRIEYFAPTAAPPGLGFVIDGLQHLYRDPLAADLSLPGEGTAGPCHNDVSCYPEWADIARASARIDFVVGHGTYYCSGQLLNDVRQDHTPYFLTANHCVHSAGAAASAELYWRYQTAVCNGEPPRLGEVPRSLGATLIAANRSSDYSLLMLEGTLPPGLYWDGWTASPVANGTLAACVHHPSGDYTRISFGAKNGFAGCPSSSFVHIDWYDGPTEPGSSGSGIFTQDGHQLFGTLYDGPSACGRETWDCYGAFAASYKHLRRYLNAGSDDASEPNDSCAQARAVRAGTLRHRIARWNDPDWYRVTVAPGETLTVRIGFASANGQLGLELRGACDTAPIASSTDGVDGTRIAVTNRGGAPVVYSWRVFLVDDVRNEYDLTVAVD